MGMPVSYTHLDVYKRQPYTKNPDYPQLYRRITSYEYNKVVDTALELGMTDGFMQQKSSAKEEYTPPFNLEGL